MRRYTEEQLTEFFKGKKILAVSHDAGAGEILSSLLRKIGPKEVLYVLDGPAKDIFTAKSPGLKVVALSEEAVKAADIVITGTSATTEFERKAFLLAKKIGKCSVSIMDHWVNYRERFLPVGNKDTQASFDKFLTDEIWVCDEYAYDTALKAYFPESKMRLIDNYYMLDISKKYETCRSGDEEKNLLYICEPVYEDVKFLHGDGNAWGYNEYDLVDDVVKSLPTLESRFNKMIFRLHPKEDAGKYSERLAGYKGRIEVEVTSYKKTPLEEDCARACCVVGGESMALAVALILKKKVFSCLPKSALKLCVLPHKEIKHINSVKEVLDFFDNDGGKE